MCSTGEAGGLSLLQQLLSREQNSRMRTGTRPLTATARPYHTSNAVTITNTQEEPQWEGPDKSRIHTACFLFMVLLQRQLPWITNAPWLLAAVSPSDWLEAQFPQETGTLIWEPGGDKRQCVNEHSNGSPLTENLDENIKHICWGHLEPDMATCTRALPVPRRECEHLGT